MRNKTCSRIFLDGWPPTAAAPSSGGSVVPNTKASLFSRPVVTTIASVFFAAFAVFVANAQQFTLVAGGRSGYPSDAIFGPAISPPSPFMPPVGVPVFPPPGFGPTVFLAPSPVPMPPAAPGTYFVDALSSGNDAGNRFLFSVTAGSFGLPGSPVMMEAALGTGASQTLPPGIPGPGVPMEHMGDAFDVRTDFVTGATLPMFGTAALAGPFTAPPSYRDEFTLGLNVGDDVASLMMRMPVGGPAALKYSLGAAGAVPAPYTPADIISPMLPFGAPWAPAGALGLMPGDDIDALLVDDIAPAALYIPGVDSVVFSLAAGSPTLAAIGATPSDLLMAMPGGLPMIYVPGTAFGLGPMDDLDAIDVFPGQIGDFNGDERVNAADYVVWRKTLNLPVIPPGSGADGNGDGIVDFADLALWRANYGLPPGAGAALGAGLSGSVVPEPGSASLISIAVVAGLGLATARRDGRHATDA